MDIPVYLFTGFLQAGKTKFIQETLQDENFNTGEKTLIIQCEEGEIEYDKEAFPKKGSNITIVTFDDEQDLTPDRLEAAYKRSKAERVLVEYNGMWNIDSLFNAFPKGWFVCEEITIMNAKTILSYNTNMRQLVFDKLQSCNMVVFNRVENEAEYMPLHKMVRSINRRTNIGYEHVDGSFVSDTIEDPLPFDLNAPVVKIEDRDYAFFYAHMCENMKEYHKKILSFKGMAAKDKSMGTTIIAIGRQVMTCCEADIAYKPIILHFKDLSKVKTGDWLQVTGEIRLEKSQYYETEGPVMYATEVQSTTPPDPIVATFS